MTTKDTHEWQRKQATEEGPLTKYNEVLYTERQHSLKQTRGKGNAPQSCIHNAINCKLYPLTRKEEGHVQQFLKEEQRKGHIHPEMTSIRERQIIMGCRKANTYVMRRNQAMTCCHMKAFTGKKPLHQSDKDWKCEDTPIVKGKLDKTTTGSCTSTMQFKSMNALSHLQDTLWSNEVFNCATDAAVMIGKSSKQPELCQQPNYRAPKDTEGLIDCPKHQPKLHQIVKIAGKQ